MDEPNKKTKFKITIRRTTIEEFEMPLEGESAMATFDEARRIVDVRNKIIKGEKFVVAKIETEE